MAHSQGSEGPEGYGQEPWLLSLGEKSTTRVFEIGEAHALLPQVRQRAEELVRVRADFAELASDLRVAGSSTLGSMADLKALEAQVGDLRSWFLGQGIEVKGLAPLLLDFPAVLAGVSVRLCWLEGETELGWYHRADLGFLGRRPLPPTERGE